MNTKQVFETIYHKKIWGNGSSENPLSGGGSGLTESKPYRTFLSDFLQQHYDIKRVIDIGCGDWNMSKEIDFNSIDSYIGIDICEFLIQRHQSNFQNEKFQFICMDVIEKMSELPDGDLCLLKDVIQHWPNEQIELVLKYLTTKYHYIIITNTHVSIKKENINITMGGSRPIQHNAYPIVQFQPKVLLTYSDKVVFLIQN